MNTQESNKLIVGKFYHVKYQGYWTIAMLAELSEEEGLNKWVRFSAGGWSYELELDEILTEPIKQPK